MLDKADAEQCLNSAETWEKVIVQAAEPLDAASGEPPAGQCHLRCGGAWLETELDRAAAAHPNPGRPADLHRLNRTEYANAVRDLLGVEIDGTSMLPPDEQAHGFDTNADALTVVPALLDRYLTAAAKISRLALGDPDASARVRALYRRQEQLERTDVAVADRPAGRRVPVGIARRHRRAPLLSGRRRICPEGRLDKTYTGMVRGLNVPNEIEFRVDGRPCRAVHAGRPAGVARVRPRRLRRARILCLPRTTAWRCAFR